MNEVEGIAPAGESADTVVASEAVAEDSLHEVRTQLSAVRGEAFWRRLEDLARTPALREALEREFPSQAARLVPDLERRDFLRLMGASLGVMGMAACTRQPDERIVPFARNPEYVVPGRPLYFATGLAIGGAAQGLLVESHMGRPTKVEGNPDHPSSRGATDALAQAEILALYDPDRSHSVLNDGQIGTWSAFQTDLAGRIEGFAAARGEGLAILHAGEPSPTVSAQLARLSDRFPRLRTYRWTSAHRDHERAGAELAFGRDVATRYRLDRARVVVSLDADFLFSGPGAPRHARDFSAGRAGRRSTAAMTRLYSFESTVSVTGAMADERVPVTPSAVEGIARALARAVGVAVEAPELSGRTKLVVEAAARDLTTKLGAGVVLAGREADPVVHALAHAMNRTLRNVGSTVEYTLPLEPLSEPCATSVARLVEDMKGGRIDTLLILGGNPVYDAPAELAFGEALRMVANRVHLASHVNETSELCQWHVPAAHPFESWSDVRAHDGSVTLVQPLIAPLFDGKQPEELLAQLEGQGGKTPHDLLRAEWVSSSGKSGEDFERFWRQALHDGVVPGSAYPALEVPLRRDLAFGPAPAAATGLEVALRLDASAFDGRYANNAWLQETPRPLTRLTWENAALLAPATAERLGVASEDVVTIAVADRSVDAPVWVVPGHPQDTVTLHLGYGRRRAGTLGSGLGFDAGALRTAGTPWRATGARVERNGGKTLLATVQKHPDQEGRNLVRVAEFERFRSNPVSAFGTPHSGQDELHPPSLYPGFPYEGYAWGMVIDLNACIGCNACMVACQAENNVPVVGKEQVLNGREMHWIRIDRYYEEREPETDAGPTDPVVLHQPVPCMHCENAPCEVVCPVGATVHSSEGLNEMVYNRCVGTRYCSNNCPYKVRRFNFLAYTDRQNESLKMQRNPDVTVRSRGVMEKCTYCVQRISQARIQAKKEDREIRDGDVQTACQAVCPTQAITFGNINDPTSAVARLRQEPHHYGLLAETGTRPRTTYLARLRNPNPELPA